MTSNLKTALCAGMALGICGWTIAYGYAAGRAPLEGSHSVAAMEETPAVPSRIVERIDDSRLVRLRGNTHPLARPEFDRGAVDPQLPLERMILVLKRSPEQEAALHAFMDRQQDANSADYHHWLEPEEFGRIYGPSDADIAAVTNWLQNHGFSIDQVTKGRIFIEFSGTAGLVKQAFHTEMHHYFVHGEEHIANNADPSIPEALTPVVGGVWSLNDFFAKPEHVDRGSFRRDSKTGKWQPIDPEMAAKALFTTTTSNGTFEMVSPYDFATIYNVLPLWNNGIDGTGQTIAIAGRSDISPTDVANFRSAFGLPAKAPTIITNGPDPGVPSDDDKLENSLDVEWSGAVAKGATIKFVTTKSTTTSDGAFESALYIVENKVAPIMSFSYGLCELFAGTSGNTAYNSLWQEGAAANISEFVAAGDQGSAVCDGGGKPPYEAEDGLAVSASSSTPYDVAVGGTDFQWANLSGTYWNSSNAANGSSALGYIPEIPWNDTCTNTVVEALIGATKAGADEEQTCDGVAPGTANADLDFLLTVVGGTGGVSACTVNSTTSSTTTPDPGSCSGGYAKPSWQKGTGVPADGKRDVPDLSLFAADGLLSSMYIVCDSQKTPCTFSNPDDAVAQGVGGTSVASPAMAGIMALVLQKVGGAAQGLPNQVFYELAAKDKLTSCNSNTVAGGNSCIFYDVTISNNSVPCIVGDTDCSAKHTGDTIGILPGYNAGTGYDLATGLGTVNAENLVNNWPGVTPSSSVTLTPSTLAFPNTAKGATSEAQSISVKNTGAATVTLKSISITGADSTSFVELNTCGTSLGAGASCTVFVAFKPAAAAVENATLSVSDTASGSPQTATLSGTGTATDSVTLSASRLTFSSTDKGATSEAQSVTVSNKGTSTLNITGITITGSGASSFTELTTCGPTLAPSTSCSIDIAFQPATTGSLSATLSVADNGSHSPQTVALSGTGAQ